MNTNPLGVVGLMLTLAGLVGSFFNIQLSQWLRDLVALEHKVVLNKAHGTAEQHKAIIECRIEHHKLGGAQNYILNFLVMSFVIFVLANGLLMIRTAKADPLYPYVSIALWVFLLFFAGVSGYLTHRGWQTARRTRALLERIEYA